MSVRLTLDDVLCRVLDDDFGLSVGESSNEEGDEEGDGISSYLVQTSVDLEALLLLSKVVGPDLPLSKPNALTRADDLDEDERLAMKALTQIMWKPATASHFSQKCFLSLRRVVEIRTGQRTSKFDKFPYEQVEDKSFSLIFESESNKFAKLDSLDVICEAKHIYDGWMEGLHTLVSGSQWLNLFPPRYKNSDPTILWLKQIWALKVDEDRNELKQNEAIKLARLFQPLMSQPEAKYVVKCAHDHQVKYTINHGAALLWDGFVLLFSILCDTSNLQLYDIYLQYAKKYPLLGLTDTEFRKFLMEECFWPLDKCNHNDLVKMRMDYDEHHQAVKKHSAGNKAGLYNRATKLLSFRGLLSFLRSRKNSVINLEHETVYQDMSQPLSHYFINSSHNSYLEGDQLTGTSSTDAYVRALLQGCRCVEIDCWDDVLNINGLSDKEPVIYHGHTLTTKIPFRSVIHTINEYGFNSSIYPIVISIENHCCSSQQSKMAKIFRAIFGERLPVVNLVELENRDRLPSPEELQGKVILKGSYSREKKANSKDQQLTMSAGDNHTSNVTMSVGNNHTSNVTSAYLRTDQRDSEVGEQLEGFPKYSRRSVRRLELEGRIFRNEQGQDDQELSFTETAKDLCDLILYCRSISIKPWNWKKQKESSISEMFSFGEPTAFELTRKFSADVLSCTERQLVRTYPRGTRFDSSNYDPLELWGCGVQLVALNFQKPDFFMHINQGFFRNNGGCGYVLKPLVMRRENPGSTGKGKWAPFSPHISVPHPDVTPVHLEIELLSGQRLSSLKKKSSSLSVDIQTYGIKHDNARMKTATHVNNFWPSWEKGEHVLNHIILMPELCLVYFKVETGKLYGQNCFPVSSLLPGIKFIPLRTNGGEHIPESGLFVRIKMTEVEEDYCIRKMEMKGGAERRNTSGRDIVVKPTEPVLDTCMSKSLNTKSSRMRFPLQKVDEVDDSNSDSDDEDFSSRLGRRKTCPAVLHGKKYCETFPSRAHDKAMHAEASAGTVEVNVEVHVQEEVKEKRKSYSLDVPGY